MRTTLHWLDKVSWRRLAACLVWLGACVPALWSAPASREYDIKAAFLYNFITFTDWPDEAFSSPESPYVIGIVGDDPFGRVLDDIVKGERIKGHPLVVRRIAQVGDAQRSHVLFISSSEERRINDILRRLKGYPVLTVADLPGFAAAGGAVNFTIDDRVGLVINPAALRAAKLRMSSKLLNLATLVGEDPSP